jgi:predicted transcriptional regulator
LDWGEAMKKLIVSIKSSSETFSDFKKALKNARKGRLKSDYFELSFDNKKDFDRFVKNIGVLSAILNHKPKSVYELAKLVDKDVSNLNKLILFFEAVGAITIKTSMVSGRAVKTPIVEYQHIEFDLKAA